AVGLPVATSTLDNSDFLMEVVRSGSEGRIETTSEQSNYCYKCILEICWSRYGLGFDTLAKCARYSTTSPTRPTVINVYFTVT
ncbi:MAG: hypothetical protein L0287_32810, partial [Anaerolineae bacterium]|nr:hypothetical protein [Anaerolineae bacterium]